MPLRRTWIFSCGHKFTTIKSEPNQSKATPTIIEPTETSPDPCFECKHAARKAEEKKNEKFLLISASIIAHHEHAKFLATQIESPAASKDPKLKSSFEKCYQDCILESAARIKELIVEFDSSKDGEFGLPETFLAGLKIMEERIRVLVEAAGFEHTRNLASYPNHDYLRQPFKDAVADWAAISEIFKKLREDYNKLAKDGFGARLKLAMTRVVQTIKLDEGALV